MTPRSQTLPLPPLPQALSGREPQSPAASVGGGGVPAPLMPSVRPGVGLLVQSHHQERTADGFSPEPSPPLHWQSLRNGAPSRAVYARDSSFLQLCCIPLGSDD